jgi:butyrate kinase
MTEDISIKKIFAINLGSTSTKVAYCENDTCVRKDTIRHTAEEVGRYATVFDQTDMRKQTILAYMDEKSIDLASFDAFVSRGGSTEPIVGGVYRINQAMVDQVESGAYGVHVCSVGCRIAYDFAHQSGITAVPLTVDTPATDEFEPIARYSGLLEIQRQSCFHALNQKAMAKYYAKRLGRDYSNLNLIIVMLGGGISVVAHERGKMVDGPDALEGEGPFSNNRCGSVPVGQLVKLCFSGKYDLEGMMRHINGEAGLKAYLGTTDLREIMERVDTGNVRATEVIDAMCYQTAKDIGAYATVLKGAVDVILLTGGMANVDYITQNITERVEFIASVEVLPGEREMESLCLSAYEALVGAEEIKEFIPKGGSGNVQELR